MGLFRNKEFKWFFLIYILCAGAASVAGFVIAASAGILVLSVSLLSVSFFCLLSFFRYRAISRLSDQLGRILHGESGITFAQNTEGELAILESDIYKMTVRLQEQSEALQQDKIYLRDSIADISHQLRTPLTAMNLIVSQLGKDMLERSERRQLIQELNRLLGRIDWLITSLLKISQIESGTIQFKKDPVNLQQLIRKAAEPLAIPMDLRSQTLQTDIPNDLSFSGDFYWTLEAISNILKNCMEHTPEGGCISVRCSESTIFTELSIEDTGPGISETDLPHLFERFYKGADSHSESIGIGLALSRMIIAKQDGVIRAENRREGGARFLIRIYKGTV